MKMARTLRVQAADILREAISQDYQPGDRLPAEPDLAQRMGLSRNTVREAIALLVNEGRLERKWGVGTTVLAPRDVAAFSVTEVAPIRRIVEASGHTPSIMSFSAERVTAGPEVTGPLRLDPDDEVLEIDRLFGIDGVPAILIRDWCKPVINGVEIDVDALRDVRGELPPLIREQTGRVLDHMEGRIDAVTRAEQFPQTGPTADSLVQISQTVFTRDGEPLIYSTIQFDTAVVDLTLRRNFAND